MHNRKRKYYDFIFSFKYILNKCKVTIGIFKNNFLWCECVDRLLILATDGFADPLE
jgi:hypothetical protein